MPSQTSNWFKPKIVKAIVNILVWSLISYLLFMYPPLIRSGTKMPCQFQLKQTVHMIMMISAYYFNSYYLIPGLLLKGKNALFALYILMILAFAGLFMARMEAWFHLTAVDHSLSKKIWRNDYIDFFGLFTITFVLGISAGATIIQRWEREWKVRQELETQRAVTELAFLKAQINPHFFFNTLNSIYSLTYSNVDSSRKVLLKLSAMMRYLLYETRNDTTVIQQELIFIKDYIDIMTLRLNKRICVDILIPAVVKMMPIAPMLLLPFIENAFKHGVDDIGTGIIGIRIEENADGITMEVENDIFRSSTMNSPEDQGIGLANTRRRLELLYNGSYELQISEIENKFRVKLKITLI